MKLILVSLCLNCIKDLAGHGGSAFKVYQRVGKELKWVEFGVIEK